ncbi:MAG: radical SAM protein [Bdellovibrionales bacterium]|jgi:sulfatase maturation enzyme AslB (radical SAM superfamily)|nr:radical SAM protein [Bdellovibrionales bacterium]MBT3525668.1 radical SAM protein [Bdellovibrionales bacterium]MBT7668196.1 radical SAM protein [Bdellovibrionales bacterium]MBT7768116.1 radical SAM protein [Bdellovibrionales bacterium]
MSSDHNLSGQKYQHRLLTADMSERASVLLTTLKTVWFNSGSRCNFSCQNCYMESSPDNDRLDYLESEDITPYLDEIEVDFPAVDQVGITGGEPFLNPAIISIIKLVLSRGLSLLILSNGAAPLKRALPRLLPLWDQYGSKLVVRISLDHYTAQLHDRQRGTGSFDQAIATIVQLAQHNCHFTIATRSQSGESPAAIQYHFKQMLADYAITFDPFVSDNLTIFPEMDSSAVDDLPEISTDCWNKIERKPAELMCASSRMVIKRRGEQQPVVTACTLLPYQSQFELGSTLKEGVRPVYLNHPFCAQFCVLGGASCK